MDKTGEPNAENENAVRLLIENGCRIDLQTDSYQEYFQKNFSNFFSKLFVQKGYFSILFQLFKDQFFEYLKGNTITHGSAICKS